MITEPVAVLFCAGRTLQGLGTGTGTGHGTSWGPGHLNGTTLAPALHMSPRNLKFCILAKWQLEEWHLHQY